MAQSIQLEPPAAGELEVSVFGPGYGEAICIHIGDGEWVLVDSCIDPPTRRPAALVYLESLRVVPADVVSLIVVTHWHDDHIRGASELVSVCTRAGVACSAALQANEVLAFVAEQHLSASGALGSGVDELYKILRICAEKRQIIWAKANLPLHPRPPGDAPTVVALSPSEGAVERTLQSLIQDATQKPLTIPRRYPDPGGSPNAASVATSIRVAEVSILLGADLEVSANANGGWDDVLTSSKPPVKASVVKVPHHASPGAHHARFWPDLAESEAVAIVTPWARGGLFLPAESDLQRLRAFTPRVFLTATPKLVKARKDSELQKLLRKLGADNIQQLRGWGHVRARRRLDEEHWRVDLYGDARPVA